MTSSEKVSLNKIVPNSVSVAMKLREGVSPQELLERTLRKFYGKPMDELTYREIAECLNQEFLSRNFFLKAEVFCNSEERSTLEVLIKSSYESS